MKSLAVLVSGNGSNLQALLDSPVRPALTLVVSNRSQAYALTRAREAGVETTVMLRNQGESRDQYDRALADYLNTQGIELVVLAGWMHILGEHFLNTFEGETINLHPALPGEYPGLNAIERAFTDGRAETGCMVHKVILEVDAGEVLGVSRVAIETDDNLASLTERMHQAEHNLLVQVVSELTLDS